MGSSCSCSNDDNDNELWNKKVTVIVGKITKKLEKVTEETLDQRKN